MSRLVIIASLFALAVPAAFAAPPAGQGQQASTPSASELCKEQRRTIGMDAFRGLYAPSGSPKAAMDACLLAQKSIAGVAAKNAAKTCRTEQSDPSFATGHSGKSFAEFYGKNENDNNAFGKCVSSKTKEEVESSQDTTLGAAKKCKAMRATQRAAFDAAYGTKKNAFGKCVSKLSREQDD